MKLLFALVRWLFSQLFVLIVIAGLVILAAILKDWWEQRQIQELRLQTLQTELAKLHRNIQERRSDLTLEKKYMELRNNEPSRWRSPFEWYRWDKQMEALGGLIDKKNEELKKLRQKRNELVLEIEASSQALYRTQQMLTSIVRKSVKTILILSTIVFLGPFFWRAFWYFVIARLARHAPPIQLEKSNTGSFDVREARKNLSVVIRPGETFRTRMAWLHQYTPQARKRTRFLVDWKAPFISYASGLAELTEVTVPAGGLPTEIALSSAENADTFLCEIEMQDHPGLVVFPAQVVAIAGDLRLTTKWTITNLHSWIAGRLRFIIFTGTGRLYLRGMAGVNSIPSNSGGVRLSESILIAFETSLSFSTVRTETFWPYYRRLVPLFDYEFQGDGAAIRQTAPDMKRIESPTVRIFDSVLNGIGKLLGL